MPWWYQLCNVTCYNCGSDVEFVQQSLEEAAELRGLLARASMANKTVIITTLNDAWAANNTMIDLYLGSFRRGRNIKHLLQHLVIVTLDQKAHDRCMQLHPHCFRLKTARGVDFTGEKSFMSEDYLRMMWKRIKFLGIVLEMGYNFVFSVSMIKPFENWFEYVGSKVYIDGKSLKR